MNSPLNWNNEQPLLPGLTNASQLYCSAFASGLALDPDRTVSEWADEHRILSKMSSGSPGKWHTEVTPYLREIMDALSPSDPTRVVVLQSNTQFGKTETGNNWVGSIIDQGLGPTMIVWPTSNAAKKNSRTRIGPMIQETLCLREKVREAKSRDSGNTILLKEFDGGVLICAGANSATELKSSPVRNLFLDEIEEYPDDVDGQGDPEDLAERRQDRFANSKVFRASTPTITNGRIDRHYKASDQRRYFVACPLCDHLQILVFDQLRWETRKVWEVADKETGEVLGTTPDTVGALERDTGELVDCHYECVSCKGRIDEHLKPELLADIPMGGKARWVAQNPGPDRAKGYKGNALMMPLGARMTWRVIILEWLAAQRDPSGTKLKTFWNTILGEAYDEAGEAIEAHFLKARVESWWRVGGTVPAKCLLLTTGVDVQHNRLEAYVWGEGRYRESWLIDRHVIFGSPALEATWLALDDLLAKGYPHAGGNSLRITAMAIDSGDGVTTHFVRVYARKWAPTRRVIALKGQAIAGRAVIGKPSKQDVNHHGNVIKGGVEIWQYGSDTAKGSLYARLKLEPPKTAAGAIDWMAVQAGGIPGYVHFPSGLPDEVFDQITAERRVTRYLRGQPHIEWVLEKGRRNEALDCAGMADAAAEYAGRSRLNWDQLERAINPPQQDPPAVADATPAPGQPRAATRQPPRRRGGFVTNW